MSSFPKNSHELRFSHEIKAKSILEVYPGGAGMRCLQFSIVRHNPNLVLNPRIDPENLQLIYDEIRAVKDIYDYLDVSEVFIFGIQDGFTGPVISYFSRIHDNNAWFMQEIENECRSCG